PTFSTQFRAMLLTAFMRVACDNGSDLGGNNTPAIRNLPAAFHYDQRASSRVADRPARPVLHQCHRLASRRLSDSLETGIARTQTTGPIDEHVAHVWHEVDPVRRQILRIGQRGRPT